MNCWKSKVGLALTVAVSALALIAPRIVSTQPPGGWPGVVQDSAGYPIPNALITVIDLGNRAFTIQLRSNHDGSFRLISAADSLEIRVQNIGHRATTFRITIDTITNLLALTVSAVDPRLQTIVVTETQMPPFQTAATTSTVRQLPPVGEADVFRALTFLPAVVQPNDLLSRVHLAGGASDEHAILLDGHPLQSPFHGPSFIGAFNVAALERADVNIHHRSPSRDGHLSGEVELTTRRPAVSRRREAVLSLFSTSGTVQHRLGGIDLLTSGRVTYLDQILAEYSRQIGASGDDLHFPSFADGLIRIGRSWENGSLVELIGFGYRDRLKSGGSHPSDVPLQWGEEMVGVRTLLPVAEWMALLRVSRSRAHVRRQRRTTDPTEFRNLELDQLWTSGEVTLARAFGLMSIGFGGDVMMRNHLHRWSEGEAEDVFKSEIATETNERTTQTAVGGFLEVKSSSSDGQQSATAGLHTTILRGKTYLAPRMTFTSVISPNVRASVAVNRRYQFDAIAGEPEEGSVIQPVFFIDRPRVVDALALTVDKFGPPSGTSSISLTTFYRLYRDRTVFTTLVSPPEFDRVSARSLGGSATGDHLLFKRLAVRGSYTYQRSIESINGSSSPSSWDSPHQFNGFAALALGRHWAITTAAHFRSGTAVTPIDATVFVPLGAQLFPRHVPGTRNSINLPSYRRLDIGVRHQRSSARIDWSASAQVINVLNSANQPEFDWGQFERCGASICVRRRPDRRMLPILPSLGLEVRW